MNMKKIKKVTTIVEIYEVPAETVIAYGSMPILPNDPIETHLWHNFQAVQGENHE